MNFYEENDDIFFKPVGGPSTVTNNLYFYSYFTLTITIKVKTAGANMSEDFSKALDEMMENIKRGKTLRPALKPIRKVRTEIFVFPNVGTFSQISLY